jgi:FkbM family methyltransferase
MNIGHAVATMASRLRFLGELAQRLVSDTPLEGPAQWAWSRLKCIGHPRARQSLTYDLQTVQILRRILQPNSNCVDIGAHYGSILKSFVSFAPDGEHFAFEPLPKLAERLRKRFPKVQVQEVALSDETGEATFCYVADDPGLSGFRKMGHVRVGAVTQELRVRTARLDDLLPESLPIAFIKIDVEGAQLQVLRGATTTIMKNRPFIVFEHGMLAKESYGTTSEMIFELLVDRCGLKLSLMSDWLAGGSPLRKQAFVSHVGYHSTSHFCFLAHP